MEKIYSIEERVILLVEEFLTDLSSKEPFPSLLSEYRFNLRSKLIQLLSQFPNDAQARNASFDSALEGIVKSLEEAINRANLQEKKELMRLIKTLEETNEVLKEFLYGDQIRDKSVLSKVSGRIGEWAEKLNIEFRRRFGGLINRIKSLFGR
ncbi:MAG: hypothetical protein RMH93_03010 [Aquificaceae bacterium]|nr:hypothetical protein [Aquificaceae bacterium]MCS7196004.1 hypothetical protein [Aquificaceae bacterium]MDW8032498.1 hypothetical protein [Aquificaceae bacterium]MDW8294292.1 hypothetical protein [Aquificaceae bacterium]